MARFPHLRFPRAGAALLQALGLAAWLLAASGAQAAGFGFDEVAERARLQALQPYDAKPAALPQELARLGYDEYRDIRYRPERALWRDQKLPFELVPLHRGGRNVDAVRLNELTPAGVRPLAFQRADFHYGKNALPEVQQAAWGDLGFAGFRIHYPLNNPRYKDELIVFLGASYFRALGAGQIYGLSARGLAIDTIGAGAEEFPRFPEFWIERPAPGATALTIYALLDSPRASGAYRFTVRPGDSTAIDVRLRLFLRAPVAPLALAPLTSMFTFGENQPQRGDFRPEVHDSDGLMLAGADGEWLWHPLVNPARPLVRSFAANSPRGFGLMQRDRAFASYEDTEARYEKRPSAWVEPLGDWGAGRVDLVQLPTPDETHDNVVAYWVPAQALAPGRPFDFAYRLHLQGERQQRPQI